jgi:hypothetical protein
MTSRHKTSGTVIITKLSDPYKDIDHQIRIAWLAELRHSIQDVIAVQILSGFTRLDMKD